LPEAATRPKLAIIAGPNGSGKSTFFQRSLRSAFPVFVNADDIAKGLSGVAEGLRELTAAEIAENERNRLTAQGTSFAFETVFSRTDYWLDFYPAGEGAWLFRRLVLHLHGRSRVECGACRYACRRGRTLGSDYQNRISLRGLNPDGRAGNRHGGRALALR
jgi:hypothetical protein